LQICIGTNNTKTYDLNKSRLCWTFQKRWLSEKTRKSWLHSPCVWSCHKMCV